MRPPLLRRSARCGVMLTLLLAAAAAQAQLGGGQGGRPPSGVGGAGNSEIVETPRVEKPDILATKFYAAGMKSLKKAKEYEEVAEKAGNADKKSNALSKVSDNYTRALDQFTEALSNNGDMVDAWNNVGYVHLRLGAFAEAIDDYNHTLKLRPDLPEAILHRAEAYMAVDRLDDAKSAYMDLFNHERPLADQLMTGMQSWLEHHKTDPNGIRPAVVDSFGKWLQERDGIAKQTASVQGEAPAQP